MTERCGFLSEGAGSQCDRPQGHKGQHRFWNSEAVVPPEPLVQIQLLPPLTQSAYELMACPRSYVAVEVEGRKTTTSIPADRGLDVHDVMARYTAHCAASQLESDWEEFDRMAAASGSEAGRILDGIRDRHIVDWERVYQTELPLALDEEFRPAYRIVAGPERYPAELPWIPGTPYSREPAAHLAKLDVVLLSKDLTRAKVDDFKTSAAVFDADTYQSNLYALMLFQHIPTLEAVTFELVFVRYANCFRSVLYSRADVPAMMAEVSRARERQYRLHERPALAQPLPCKACTWCPLAKDLTCPIADWNEYTVLTPSDRLRALEFYRRMKLLYEPMLREEVETTGKPVTYQDGNGRVIAYGPQEVPETRVPLSVATLQALLEWQQATGENLLDGRLNVSRTKLRQLLDTKKRTPLREKFEESILETGTKPKYRLGVQTPDEGVVAEQYHEEA